MKSPLIFDKFVYLLIIANVLAMILESHVSIRNVYGDYFHIFEAISIYIFSFEYLYRIRLAYLDKRLKGVWKYVFSTFGLIDLISILPFYLNQFVKVDGRFLRILRLFRLTRIFKLGRGSSSLKLFVKALKGVRNELKFTLFLSVLAILFSASAIYYLENEAQPDKFSSITESIWWATVSLATVGYGDVYPITAGGKIFASIISLIGIGIVAIPTGIISASFVEEIYQLRRKK
ncbi:MAG: ion transporter [Bacteroidetes bacterium]|nr:ion transporter [Bacteroidota bacterium]